MSSNQGFDRSAKQRDRCSVPGTLRMPAPGQAQRWASVEMRAAIFALAVAALGSNLALASASEGLRLIFPALGLARNQELIEEVQVTVSCGHIASVAGIPMDWSIDVVRMTAGEEQLHASAGHGASRLWALGKFNGGIRVVPQDSECFDVTAKILVSGERSREIELPRQKLKLRP